MFTTHIHKKTRSKAVRVRPIKGEVTCPNCNKSNEIETSSYVEFDYFCTRCQGWFLEADQPNYSPLGDALDRLKV